MTKPLSPAELVDHFKRSVNKQAVQNALPQSDQPIQRFEQVADAIVLVGVLHPLTDIESELDLNDFAEAVDLFLQLVVTHVTKYNGVPYRHLGSTIMCGFGAPPVSAPAASQGQNAFTAMKNIFQAITAQNEQRATQSKQPLNTGFGIVSGKIMGGIRGFEDYLSYELVGRDVQLTQAIAQMAEHGHCWANAKFVEQLSWDVTQFSTTQIQLTNGTIDTVYRIVP